MPVLRLIYDFLCPKIMDYIIHPTFYTIFPKYTINLAKVTIFPRNTCIILDKDEYIYTWIIQSIPMDTSILAKEDTKPSKEGITLGKDSIKPDILKFFVAKDCFIFFKMDI